MINIPQLLEQVSRKPVEDDFMDARDHASKNRYPDHLPCESDQYSHSMTIVHSPFCYTDYEYRLCLRPSPDGESQYINASFIDVRNTC